MLTFFEEPFSHWCVKVRKIMKFKHIQFETRNVGYHDKRDLIKATGQDYVPAIVNDREIITYSDIPDYLEKLVPNPSIYPDSTKNVAKTLENWAHYRLEEIVWRYVVVDFPKTFKDDLERWVFVEIQELKRGPLEVMEARRSIFKSDMDAHLQLVENMLTNHKFLLGGEPSLADFAVFGAIFPITYSRNEIPEKFTRLRSWYKTIDAI